MEAELSIEYHHYVESNRMGLLSAAHKYQDD